MNEKVLATAKNYLAEFLKNRRLELGLTQSELATKTGMRQHVISNIEAGQNFLTTKQLWRLCNGLDLYFFIEDKDSGTDVAEKMKWRFQGGQPASKN